ncbi:MAG: diguanylate cyclase [Pseudomonadota bacterium]
MAWLFKRLETVLIGSPRQLWQRYVFAIFIVCGLIGTSHVLQTRAIDLSFDDATSINDAGRQRMLSQRILFLTELSHQTGDVGDFGDLEAAIDLFATSHARLTELRNMPRQLEALYFSSNGLDEASRNFIDLAESYLTSPHGSEAATDALSLLVGEGRAMLLSQLDLAVSILEHSATQRLDDALRAAELIFTLALLILAVEAFLIFLPAQISVNRALDGLEQRNHEIQETKKELQQKAIAMEYAATHDPLTGLGNRKQLFDVLDEALAVRFHQDGKLAAFQVDLDRFKSVNDTYGHPAGDAVLQSVAYRLEEIAPDALVIARMGGDEIALVLRALSADPEQEVLELAEAMIARISAPMVIDGSQVRIGASVGIALTNQDAVNSDGLLAQADTALYSAKRRGRGVAELYDVDLASKVVPETNKVAQRTRRRPRSSAA